MTDDVECEHFMLLSESVHFIFFHVSLNTEDDGSKLQIWSVLAIQDQAITDGYLLPIMSTAIKSMKSLTATGLL